MTPRRLLTSILITARRRGLLTITALALAGCASAGRYAPMSRAPQPLPPPSGKAEARRQLNYYVAQLARHRRALGFAPDAGPSVQGRAESAPARLDVAGRSDDAAASPPRPAKKRMPQAMRRARSSSPGAAESVALTKDAGGSARAPRCPLPCRQARGICHAARRICKLADYLDEDSARARCQQAREDCRQARRNTADRCQRVCAAKPA